jgi:DNA (cytosine-5)-methyltransferase 1
MAGKPTFIDLFCGCGGFTLGMLRAGFQCKAAIDFNSHAVATLKTNLSENKHPDFSPVEHALERDLTQFPPADLEKLIGTRSLDVIVGGPPCQGFSTARQRDGSNHGTERLKDDPRRHLYRQFLNYVEHFQPKVFVIENVLGLRSAGGGRYFTAVQHESRILGQAAGRPGYRVHAQIERGEDLGVPQKRRRQLIIGVRADLPGYFPTELKPVSRATLGTMLGDAIGDLPPLEAGTGKNECAYDLDRRDVKFFSGVRDNYRRSYLRKVAEVQKTAALTNHEARPHSARDLRDFALLPEGSSSAELMRSGVAFEFPYKKTTFKDRYTRQHRNRPCSTIVAHLSKDGLMFIHPTQNRSLTPREAARVQSFPDWFIFPAARTHSFRQIGNAVPPLVSEAVGAAVRDFLLPEPAARGRESKKTHTEKEFKLPNDLAEAARWLHPLMHADRKAMRAMPAQTFLRGWHALLWLFPELHPESALEHGGDKHETPTPAPGLAQLTERYTRSGWPVVLESLGVEAWRRFKIGEFSNKAFYCVPVQRAGLQFYRQPAAVVKAAR